MSEFKMYKIFENADEVAGFLGERWRVYQAKHTKRGLFFVSSPLSSTPLPLYRWVIENADSFENWDNFRFILMDEQVDRNHNVSYVDSNDSASYEKFLREKLLNPLQRYLGDINRAILRPGLQDLGAFDGMIEEHNGIDLLILAIGARGHYAQVMPGISLDTGFHIARLIPEFIETHTKASGPYQGARFREYGMSLGPRQVLSAKNVIVMITGESKRELAEQLLSYDSFDPEYPISIIHHPEVREKTEVFISKDASGI